MFAADPQPAAGAGDVSITIYDNDTNNGAVKTKYHYYELFHASIAGEAVSYYLNNGTEDTLRGLLDAVTVNGKDLFTFTKTADGARWIVSINKKDDNSEYTDSDGAAIANALNTAAIKGVALSNAEFVQSDTGSVYTNVPETGYYLITSTLGTNLVLQTLGKVAINTKNEYVTDSKTVAETSYNVGDKVTYTITVNIPATVDYTKPIVVHDTLQNVLKIDLSSVHAKVTADNDFDSHITAAAAAAGDATEHPVVDGYNNYDFTLDINSLAPAAGESPVAKSVVITYQAEVLSTAMSCPMISSFVSL